MIPFDPLMIPPNTAGIELTLLAMRAAPPGLVPAAAGAVAAILLATATNTASGVFGVLDNTADELADLLGVDEVPEFAAQAVRLARPAYEPLKMVSASCTEALFPEFNDVNDMNDCLLLHQRVLWRGRQRPLLVRQTMSKDTMWSSSTGSAIWGGGVVLQRYMELLGSDFWAGKRVLELGTGTGVGSISAAKLGAAEVVATDRDAAVLELADGVRLHLALHKVHAVHARVLVRLPALPPAKARARG